MSAFCTYYVHHQCCDIRDNRTEQKKATAQTLSPYISLSYSYIFHLKNVNVMRIFYGKQTPKRLGRIVANRSLHTSNHLLSRLTRTLIFVMYIFILSSCITTYTYITHLEKKIDYVKPKFKIRLVINKSLHIILRYLILICINLKYTRTYTVSRQITFIW